MDIWSKQIKAKISKLIRRFNNESEFYKYCMARLTLHSILIKFQDEQQLLQYLIWQFRSLSEFDHRSLRNNNYSLNLIEFGMQPDNVVQFRRQINQRQINGWNDHSLESQLQALERDGQIENQQKQSEERYGPMIKDSSDHGEYQDMHDQSSHRQESKQACMVEQINSSKRQEQILSEGSSINFTYQEINTKNRRKRKMFICGNQCSRKDTSKNRIRKHRKNCKTYQKHRWRKQVKDKDCLQKEDAILKNKLNKISQMVPQERNCEEGSSSLQARIAKIQQMLKVSRTRQDWFNRAKNIVQNIIGGIQVLITSKLSQALATLNSGSDLTPHKQSQVANLILNKLNTMDFSDTVVDFKQILFETSEKIKQQSKKCNQSNKTLRNQIRAFSFLTRFNEIQLMIPSSIYNQLEKEKTFATIISSYWKRLRSSHQYLSKFPDLPRVMRKKKRVLQRKTQVNLSVSSNEIVKLCNNDIQLAADMWLIMTLGLRYHDLLKIRFVSKDGQQYYKSVKLIERKNQHRASRYLPKSLVQIAIASKQQYPITQQRLRKAVKSCLSLFGTAYGFKHQALTLLLAQLHRSSSFAQMHAQSSTTLRYYLNDHESMLIDQIFKLNVHFQWDVLTYKKIDSRNLQLDLTQSQPHQVIISPTQLIQLTIDCRVNEAIIETDALDGIVSIIPSTQGLQIDRNSLKQMAVVSTNHGAQLQPEEYSHISDIVQKLSSRQIVSTIENEISYNQSMSIEQGYAQVLSDLSQRSVHFYSFSNQQSEEPQRQYHYNVENSRDVPIILVKTNNVYKSSTSQSLNLIRQPKRQSRKESLRALSRIRIDQQLTKILPSCSKCDRKLHFTYQKVQCQSCDQVYVEKTQASTKHEIPHFSLISVDQITDLLSIATTKTKNNLIQVVNQDYPHKYSKKSIYLSDFPNSVFTKYYSGSTKFKKEVEKNIRDEELLPLTIGPSSIIGAGKGIFATRTIPENMLILTYRGCIGTNFSIEAENNDSIFTLGWIKGPKPCEIFIDGLGLVSPARYINSSSSQFTANLKSGVAIIDNFPVVFFISKKEILHDQQLKFYYGDKYWEKKYKRQTKQS